jgi:hypothetical protein
MTETAQPKRGGRAYHSILEPHLDFIRELRQRRKTWKEIAEALFIEKGVHVTLYAPYRFYQRQLKRRAKGHWEDAENQTGLAPTRPKVAAKGPQAQPAPLPAKPAFKQPDLNKLNDELT